MLCSISSVHCLTNEKIISREQKMYVKFSTMLENVELMHALVLSVALTVGVITNDIK